MLRQGTKHALDKITKTTTDFSPGDVACHQPGEEIHFRTQNAVMGKTEHAVAFGTRPWVADLFEDGLEQHLGGD